MPSEGAGEDGVDSGLPTQATRSECVEISHLECSPWLHVPGFAYDQIPPSFDDFVLLGDLGSNSILTPYSNTIPTSQASLALQTSHPNFDASSTLVASVPGPSTGPDTVGTRSSPLSNPQSELTTPSPTSWVITTPNSRGSLPSPPAANETSQELVVTPEGVNEYTQYATTLGPCSKNWVLPSKTRRRRGLQTTAQKLKRIGDSGSRDGPRRRGPFKTEDLRQQTAATRTNRSCIRCRMLQNRCQPDLDNPRGVCLNCKNVARPIICKLPCLRWIITDSSLYREQPMPYQLFSKRWQNMDLVDITTWASSEVKTISISQIFLDAPYEVEVREFVPTEGDMVEAMWKSGSVVKSHGIPLYALSDMESTSRKLVMFIDENVAQYIYGAVYELDDIFWGTYMFAFRHMNQAKTDEERKLLQNTFRLWVGCRKTSNPHHIYGEDKLGGEIVDDPASLFHNVVPMPVIMISQMECIMYTKVLRPMSKKVLHDLNDLVRKNKKQYWLTIYLTMFILLHSCSMITRRDWETARQYDLHEEFANPESIRKHHSGAEVMLAHFHYLNKGAYPFRMNRDAKQRQELARAATLDDEQVDFVWQTATLINDPQRKAKVEEVRSQADFNHDLYWVSQLYDEDWQPGPSA